MTAAPAPDAFAAVARLFLKVNGAVQGVGMRPFVHRLATECGLAGYVRNGADGVTIEVEGARVEEFVRRLETEIPPLARIDTLLRKDMPTAGDAEFVIRESLDGETMTRIVADAATCDACLGELFDPASRYFAYPFVNCTHCGPRYTITRRLPYDRRQTSMASFPMCPDCGAAYTDVRDRRFHAEPVACPTCGPKLSHPVSEIVDAIRAGRIVALKGIGGFHLVCDARNAEAVSALRARKAREFKPFALMVANAASISAIAEASPEEKKLCSSTARPIVLMRAKPGVMAPAVSPGLSRVGVMLAYAPVHHLLFAALAGHDFAGHDPHAANDFVLVATSANPGGEPLVVDDEDATRRLVGIADLIVTHDRAIVVRADDSVAQVIAGAPSFLRRARGYVPEPIALSEDGPATLALGAHLKSTVTLTRGREAFVSQHVGDLDTAETLKFYRETIAHLIDIVGVKPELVASDLHPDYRSSQMAEEFGPPVVRVQHHAAHVAAVAAEAGLDGPALGLALDGHGLGDDGGAWGGELLLVDGANHRRLGHLASLPLPGGDRAAREPWRMGAGALAALGRSYLAATFFPDRPLAGPIADRVATGADRLATTSLGRLFDAAAALLGVRAVQDYEGQAAMELEALVDKPIAFPGGFALENRVLSFAPLLAHFALARPDARTGAALFHGTLIEGFAALACHGATATGLTSVALGGGCLMNRVLAEGLSAALAQSNLTPLLARRLPANDGGLSFGQAVLARRAFSEI
ncbi:carbamoyltransferase HypF [Pleomorphomonas diazotrophica]|uniref:Carbamoyltransferase HypF n=1 Tax=Pleomorphomonas diazotrophica TaxID=1166257 RepID=A0A1I4Q9W1_9HYPH|nr:carbamoyltransferase HypF [Pleomorphomonas diazotrophica]PKR91122.1 carbamoyltransferase HypF [Pleomorphomonas diazotrophica]SFM36878.1 Hydrogenase maturation protein, carbamoyltransferase HypF [Pleomorphomonas diazotrophica]